MSQALYRKYRSRSLDEVLGQDHVTGILRAALKQGKIAHAYLLTGPRGVGKTSVARILAHEINGLPYEADATHLDIIEIDAASNNGVDDIRLLREKAQVAPVSAAKKIYIIDEVHMLSKPAFNALLKTLEEPPAHIVFILATTDADKLPATILSRVQQFYFRPITSEVIARRLVEIAELEGFSVDEAAAQLIAEQSRGGFRDAISLLDQLSPLASMDEPLTPEHVAAHLGLTGQDAIRQLITAYHREQGAEALELLRQLEGQGHDPLVLTQQLLSELRHGLHDQPANLTLIRELIDVTRHPHPDLKLLTIFGRSGEPVATPPTPEAVKRSRGADVSAERSRKISGGDLSEKSTLATDGGADGDNTAQYGAVREISAREKAQKITRQPKEANRSKADKAAPTTTEQEQPATLDWQSILAKAKAASTGLHSLLAKCNHVQNGTHLTIYTGTKFAAKKLENDKFRSLLSGIIATMAPDIELEFRGEPKPPEDENLAKIAEMMGGGEEVKLEDMS